MEPTVSPHGGNLTANGLIKRTVPAPKTKGEQTKQGMFLPPPFHPFPPSLDFLGLPTFHIGEIGLEGDGRLADVVAAAEVSIGASWEISLRRSNNFSPSDKLEKT